MIAKRQPMLSPPLKIYIPDRPAMAAFAVRLAGLLAPGDVVAFNGQLGAGKTTLIQMLGEALGVRGDVAWAQSILETGFFVYPGRGKVQPLDDNWAGIGACEWWRAAGSSARRRT